MKKAFQVVLRGILLFVEVFFGFGIFYFMLFHAGGFWAVGDLKTNGDVRIFVTTNGVHTDFCLPVETDFFDWKTVIPTHDFPNNKQFKYVSIGWGDKGFFLDTPEWSDLTVSTAFNAAFLPSKTAMHVTYRDYEPAVSASVVPAYLDQDSYHKLIDFIMTSFDKNGPGIAIIPNRGYGKHDNFYEAKGAYHLFRTCNSWTNEGLKITGIKTGWFALSSEGIMRHLR